MYYNRHCKAVEFEVSSEVLFNTRFIALKGSRKFKARFIIPYKILKCIGYQAYKLVQQLSLAKLHCAFCVSLFHYYCHSGDWYMVAITITLDAAIK